MAVSKTYLTKFCLIAGLLGLVAAGCEKKDTPTAQPDKTNEGAEKNQKADDTPIAEMSKQQLISTARKKTDPFGTLPDTFPSEDNPITEEKVKLGRMLYYDKRFSKDNSISCNSCHMLDEYGVDRRPTSPGHDDTRGPRNSPTVYNAAGHISQFWDGRAADVEEQAKGPVLNPIEMGMPSKEKVNEQLTQIDGYPKLFKKAFPEQANPANFDNMAKAIGAFERKLTTPGSDWDKFLKGDDSAMTEKQLKGFLTFRETGCDTCHTGELVGGSMYQKLGLVKPWPDKEDLGRYEVTEKESDKMKFKVPSLRNVTETAPYYHDGSIESLEKAVRKMAVHQLGKELSDQQVEYIIAYLESLTGEIPSDYVEKPTLPGNQG
jgi:cytochrome c peroxidase